MKYFSTRNKKDKVTAQQAITRGLAPDGGLYVPEEIPTIPENGLERLCSLSYRGRAAEIMSMFLDDFTKKELEGFAAGAYGDNYDDPAIAPVYILDDATGILELWHGPTSAFKDMALQMLPYLLTASMKKTGEERRACILVATSGDTGKAALEGFADIDGTRIMVFYPHDGVSEVQKLQMVTQKGANVNVCAVEGNFDDTQTGVKSIFGNNSFAAEIDLRGYFLSSANSINWGRLLPQIVYYISAYCDYVNNGGIRLGEKINFCVPTGNFGNILAGWYAKRMGLPVNMLICASNSNNVLTDFINDGVYDRNRDFFTTISPSMDILVSSNLERLLYGLEDNNDAVKDYMLKLSETGRYEIIADMKTKVSGQFAAGFCGEDETKNQIARVFAEKKYLMDTHTAVGYKVLCDYRDRTGDMTKSILVSTASPYKFCESVLQALGGDFSGDGPELLGKLHERTGIEIPRPLRGLDRKTVRFNQCIDSGNMLSAVKSFLRK